MKEETIKETPIFSGNVFDVQVDDILDHYGNPSKRELVLHRGGVGVVAIDENENIILVKQYRYAVKKVMSEIPAGKLEFGEDPEECGKRELLEETGYKSDDFISLGTLFPSPAFLSEEIYIFLAINLKFLGQNLDSGEYLEVEKIPLKEALKMVLEDKIKDSKTQIGIIKAYNIIKNSKGEKAGSD